MNHELAAIRTQIRVALLAGRDTVDTVKRYAKDDYFVAGRHMVVCQGTHRFAVAVEGVCENGKQVGPIKEWIR